MTKMLAITAAALFTVSAEAADSYSEFTAGNPDSGHERITYEGVTATQPGVGSTIDRYQGLGQGNPDLFTLDIEATADARHADSERPDIYGSFSGNPDLSF
jgi:hypothetical protein